MYIYSNTFLDTYKIIAREVLCLFTSEIDISFVQNLTVENRITANETYSICKGEHCLQNMKRRRINPRKFRRETREIFARQKAKYSKSWYGDLAIQIGEIN